MTPVSFAGLGTIALTIEAILRIIGIEFTEGSVEAALNGLVVFVGFVLLIVGQLRRKDLKYGLLRK